MRATVLVRLKPGVLDPQGRALMRSLDGMGFEGVLDARLGRVIDLQLDTEDRDAAHADVEQMCERLLANSVIERYEIRFPDA